MPPKRKRNTSTKKDSEEPQAKQQTTTADETDTSVSSFPPSSSSSSSSSSSFSQSARRITLRGDTAASSRGGGGGSNQNVNQVYYSASTGVIVCGHASGTVRGYALDRYNDINGSDADRIVALMEPKWTVRVAELQDVSVRLCGSKRDLALVSPPTYQRIAAPLVLCDVRTGEISWKLQPAGALQVAPLILDHPKFASDNNNNNSNSNSSNNNSNNSFENGVMVVLQKAEGSDNTQCVLCDVTSGGLVNKTTQISGSVLFAAALADCYNYSNSNSSSNSSSNDNRNDNTNNDHYNYNNLVAFVIGDTSGDNPQHYHVELWDVITGEKHAKFPFDSQTWGAVSSLTLSLKVSHADNDNNNNNNNSNYNNTSVLITCGTRIGAVVVIDVSDCCQGDKQHDMVFPNDNLSDRDRKLNSALGVTAHCYAHNDWIVSTRFNSDTLIYNIKTHKVVVIPQKGGYQNDVYVDDSVVIVSAMNSCNIYDTTTGETIFTIPDPNKPPPDKSYWHAFNCLYYDPQARTLYLGTSKDTVIILDFNSTYQAGDIVWARLKKSHFWFPAKIHSPPNKETGEISVALYPHLQPNNVSLEELFVMPWGDMPILNYHTPPPKDKKKMQEWHTAMSAAAWPAAARIK